MDRKKIAILSVYDVYNYGSILQTYATQQVIKELGLLRFSPRKEDDNV